MRHILFLRQFQTVSTTHQVSAIPQFSVVSYSYLHNVRSSKAVNRFMKSSGVV